MRKEWTKIVNKTKGTKIHRIFQIFTSNKKYSITKSFFITFPSVLGWFPLLESHREWMKLIEYLNSITKNIALRYYYGIYTSNFQFMIFFLYVVLF